MSDLTGGLSLQSGFVIAVLIAAVFLIERIGGDDAFLRRGTQVALAVVITLTVFSGTSAFIRPPDPPEDVSSAFGGSSDGSTQEKQQREKLEEFARESSQRESESGTIHLGIGIALIAVGAFALRRLVVLPITFVLAGALLLFLGAPTGDANRGFTDTFTAIYSAYLPGRAEPGQARDIAQFLVLLVGTAMLLAFTLWRWENIRREPGTESLPPPTFPDAA